MHGEAADKPRYSFNFRVGLGKKEKEKKKGEEKNGKGGLIKRANVAPRGEVEAGEGPFGARANECTLILKNSFVNVFVPILMKREKKFYISLPDYSLMF